MILTMLYAAVIPVITTFFPYYIVIYVLKLTRSITLYSKKRDGYDTYFVV